MISTINKKLYDCSICLNLLMEVLSGKSLYFAKFDYHISTDIHKLTYFCEATAAKTRKQLI